MHLYARNHQVLKWISNERKQYIQLASEQWLQISISFASNASINFMTQFGLIQLEYNCFKHLLESHIPGPLHQSCFLSGFCNMNCGTWWYLLFLDFPPPTLVWWHLCLVVVTEKDWFLHCRPICCCLSLLQR